MNFLQEVQSKNGSVTDELLLVARITKSEENQGQCLRNDDKNDEINEILLLTLFVFVCFYCKGFYHFHSVVKPFMAFT